MNKSLLIKTKKLRIISINIITRGELVRLYEWMWKQGINKNLINLAWIIKKTWTESRLHFSIRTTLLSMKKLLKD